MKRTFSVIMPAFNEEAHVGAAIDAVCSVLNEVTDDYEVLVFNDGSRDRTGDIARSKAQNNPFVRVIDNPGNRGLSYIAREGIRLAQKNYLTWFPGDNSIEKESLKPILAEAGKADIVVAYMANVQGRPFLRRCLSRTYTGMMNVLFGLRIRYYNGATVYPSALAKSIKIRSQGYEFFAELLIRCLKSGCSYIEMPFYNKAGGDETSKSIKLKNIISIFKTTAQLWLDLYVRKNSRGIAEVKNDLL